MNIVSKEEKALKFPSDIKREQKKVLYFKFFLILIISNYFIFQLASPVQEEASLFIPPGKHLIYLDVYALIKPIEKKSDSHPSISLFNLNNEMLIKKAQLIELLPLEESDSLFHNHTLPLRKNRAGILFDEVDLKKISQFIHEKIIVLPYTDDSPKTNKRGTYEIIFKNSHDHPTYK